MGSQKPSESVLKDIDGPVLVALGNWLAESLDASELSNEQALLLFVLLDRGINALWREFPHVLLPLVMRAMERFNPNDE